METTPAPIKVYIHWTNLHTMYDATGQPVPLPTHAAGDDPRGGCVGDGLAG